MWAGPRPGRDRLGGVTGRLVLGGAPLGQPGDVGPRLREVMASADVLAVEDTRRLHRLAADLGVTFTGRVVTFHESVEQARLPGLVAALADGATVLLLTDAGMPSVSDPGYTLVRAAIEAGVPVTSVPGPSAVTTALAVSGSAGRPVLLRGLPAAQGRRAAVPPGRRWPTSGARWSSSSRRTGWPTRWPTPRPRSGRTGRPPSAGS